MYMPLLLELPDSKFQSFHCEMGIITQHNQGVLGSNMMFITCLAHCPT